MGPEHESGVLTDIEKHSSHIELASRPLQRVRGGEERRNRNVKVTIADTQTWHSGRWARGQIRAPGT